MKGFFNHHFRREKFFKEQFSHFEDPIRGEIFSTSRLELQATPLAESHTLLKDPKRGQNLAQRIYDNSLTLEESYEQVLQAVDEQRAITPAAEWLIDNFHIVRAQLKDINDHLPPEYYRELPKLASGPLAGLPRVYAMMWFYVAHTDSHFEPESLRRFLLAYQTTQPLTIGELWAVPITLRVVMIENLRRLAVRIVGSQIARKVADRIADELLGLGETPARPEEELIVDLERTEFSVWLAVQLLQRLRFQDSKADPILNWVDQKLETRRLNADLAAAIEHNAQAAANGTVRNIITSCRLISAYNWQNFFEETSLVDQLLRQNSLYPELDFATRDRYRHVLEHLKRHSPLSQIEIAKKLLLLSDGSTEAESSRKSDLGYYLISKGRRILEKEIHFRPPLREKIARAYTSGALEIYVGGITAATLLLLFIPLFLTKESQVPLIQMTVFILLGALVASEVAVSIVNRLTVELLGPTHLPRLELKKGIPANAKTFVVVPTFLTSEHGIDAQMEQLEIHYLANSAGHLYFALLTDWTDSPTETTPRDMPLLHYATAKLKDLNRKYSQAPGEDNRFYLFHRRRLYNTSEEKWLAWERKRGKLHEFNKLLLGDGGLSFIPLPGYEQKVPKEIRYVITLDADTRMPKGCAAQLIGTMMHPLNEPFYDENKGRVTEGYGILQPRVTPTLPTLHEGTLFQIFSSGPSGVDPYASAVSDVYQDLFDEGSFMGKGIYNIKTFERALRNRVPENALLSHDLFEGAYSRAGFLSDVEFFEEFPSHTMVAALRNHRWVRGDWQLLPWILGRGGSSISALGRWKMLDNLRRSLIAPAIFFLTVLALTNFLAVAWVWAAFALGSLFIPGMMTFLTDLWAKKRSVHFAEHMRFSFEDLSKGMQRAVLSLLLLPYHAWINLDAIGRTLYRLTISKKHLLEWTTAAQIKDTTGLSLRSFFVGMRGGILLTFLAVLAVASTHPMDLALGGVLFFIWLLAPLYAQAVSSPFDDEDQKPVSSSDRESLHLTARQIWHFFATFVKAEDHFLPPDNFQEEPSPVVAHRSSPTNFGLYLLSVISAKKFGWISLCDAVHRLDKTLESLHKLPKQSGHFFNWYETTTLRPLDPKYISSVDNGNLAGHLIATAQGLQKMRTQPIHSSAMTLGPLESLRLFKLSLVQALRDIKDTSSGHKSLFARLQSLESNLQTAAESPLTENIWRELKAQAAHLHQEAQQLFPEPQHHDITTWALNIHGDIINLACDFHSLLAWQEQGHQALTGSPEFQKEWQEIQKDLTRPVSLEQIPSHTEKIETALLSTKALHAPLSEDTAEVFLKLTEQLKTARHTAESLLIKIKTAQDRAYLLFEEMDFNVLYDQNRKLFSIGMRVFENTLDPSYYDLLASEARLLSFIAIAKGDVPVSHWFCLGRSLAQVEDGSALISWSGSMFEYLMPSLVMNTPEGSLIKNTCQLAIRRQITYGRERDVPWGVSESAYNKRDLHLTYQYSNFGVPDLALKRGLGSNLVIAPYATLLAAMYEPSLAAINLRRLKGLGANGPYGFYESIDFTSSRLPVGHEFSVIKAYMAHHQGMSLVSLANFFFDNYMCRLFHAEPLVQATDLLLQERTPRAVGVIPAASDHHRVLVREEVSAMPRRYHSVNRPTPRTQILSNGNYSVMLTSAGSGYSRFQNLAVTRWREDVTQDHWGSYIFIKDRESQNVWSASYQPLGKSAENYEVTFAEDRVLFEREDNMIRSKLEIFVSPESNAEVRHLTLTNESNSPRELEITSYAEIVLNTQAADVAHPAFSNLFMETEFIAEHHALVARRRRRSSKEAELWTAHVLSASHAKGATDYETDRTQFLGRGRDIRNARRILDNEPLSKTVGAVLDPIFSLRTQVHLEPGATASVHFTTAVAHSKEEILRLAESYHEIGSFERVSSLAWAQGQVKLHYLNIEPDEAHLFQRLASRLLYLDSSLRPSSSILKHNTRDLTYLWRHGISGDFPMMLVRIEEPEDRGIVRQLLKAQEYFAMKRFVVDLVIMNGREHSYGQELQQMIESMVHLPPPPAELPQSRGKVFILREDLLSREDRLVIYTEARVALFAGQGSLADQVNRMLHPVNPPLPEHQVNRHEAAPELPQPELIFNNGLGGFTPDGREYVVTLKKETDATPAPWINVISNGNFGFQVSESGSGYTWALNSRENQITPWSNDPVCDPVGEGFYIFDLDSRCLWSPTALPIRVKDATYIARHGQGYSRFEHLSHGIHSTLTQFVPLQQAVKISELRLENRSHQVRRLSVYSYIEWLLGFSRATMAPTTVTELDSDTGLMFAFNARHSEYGKRIAFAGFLNHRQSMTGDRREFIGRNSSLRCPLGILTSEPLSNRTGAALDPCGAFRIELTIGPGEAVKIPFILGQADSREEARGIILELRGQFTEKLFAEVTMQWNELLEKVQVETPDKSLNLMLNRWLLYQNISCRYWARSGFYQAGGAFGFRDQLQDVMSLMISMPHTARKHILRAASRQFVEGDVQHWWHPPLGRGVRTHFSDDLLWLPFVTFNYLQVTKDFSILDETASFLEGPLLTQDQEDSYYIPNTAEETASLFEHCARALDRSLRVGAHGLPLIGCGDWNDGMNRVGKGGQGESVWLGWFLHQNLIQFAAIAEAREEKLRAQNWRNHAARLKEALETNGWDGQWYRRAYYDDGTPLGSSQNSECHIDSLSQSWAVISEAADPARARQAMDSMEKFLIDHEHRLLLLFTPPFDKTDHDPGYIKGYLPGVRENGGQYTHAAAWVIIAYAMLGDGAKAHEMFQLVNPVLHGDTRDRMNHYKIEPYVMAGDVYSQKQHPGRGGWSWYTGSAGWLYRAGLEYMLGLRLRGDTLYLDPCIPPQWPGFRLRYKHKSSIYEIEVLNPAGHSQGAQKLVVDGKVLESTTTLPLVDDHKTHNVQLVMGQETPNEQIKPLNH